MLLWCWQQKKSIEATKLKTGLSYPTISRWHERFRRQIPDDVVERLSGYIQEDESFFGKRKYKQPQLIVTGAIAGSITNNGRVVFEITPRRDADILEGYTIRNIEAGSTIDTDKWGGYNDLANLGMGYTHHSFDHSKGEFTCTNRIEGVWSIIKRYIRKLYGRIYTNKLELILKEWTARINRPLLFNSSSIFLKATLSKS
jgi:hypothetical protein